jgi:hypothetical protein
MYGRPVSDMTMRELEEAGQRSYEAKGRLAGEDDDGLDVEPEIDEDIYDDLRERWGEW